MHIQPATSASKMPYVFIKAGQEPDPPNLRDRFELVKDDALGTAMWTGGLATIGLASKILGPAGPLFAAGAGGFFGAVFATDMFDDSDLGVKRLGYAALGATHALIGNAGGLAGVGGSIGMGALWGSGRELVSQARGKQVYHLIRE